MEVKKEEEEEEEYTLYEVFVVVCFLGPMNILILVNKN